MPKAISLHVVICDLNHKLWPQWFPRQIFALAPAALTARHPLHSVLSHTFCPMSPGMSLERVVSIWIEKLYKFFSLGSAEACADADMLQGSRIIVKAEKQ